MDEKQKPEASEEQRTKRLLLISCMDPRLTKYLAWLQEMYLKNGDYNEVLIRRTAGGRIWPFYDSQKSHERVGRNVEETIKEYVERKQVTDIMLSSHELCKATGHIERGLVSGDVMDNIVLSEGRVLYNGLSAFGLGRGKLDRKNVEHSLNDARVTELKKIFGDTVNVHLNHINQANFDNSKIGMKSVGIVSEDTHTPCDELIAHVADPKSVLAYVIRGSPLSVLGPDIRLAEKLGVEILPTVPRLDLRKELRSLEGVVKEAPKISEARPAKIRT